MAEVKEWAVVKYLSLTVLFESCHRRHTISEFDCWSASRKSFQYNTLDFLQADDSYDVVSHLLVYPQVFADSRRTSCGVYKVFQRANGVYVTP